MVFNTLVHELFHNGFAKHRRPRSVNDIAGPESATSNMEWQIQNEGMATYVGYRARPPGLKVEDYELLDNPQDVKQRFQIVRDLLALAGRSTKADASALAKRSWEEGVQRRAFYVVGAFMSRRIEEVQGRAALVTTIEAGTKAFLAAYAQTSPPDELRLPAAR